jgi:hypothetical protein
MFQPTENDFQLPSPKIPAIAFWCSAYGHLALVVGIVAGVGITAAMGRASIAAAMGGAGIGVACAYGVGTFLAWAGVSIFFHALAQVVQQNAMTAHYSQLTAIHTRQTRERSDR